MIIVNTFFLETVIFLKKMYFCFYMDNYTLYIKNMVCPRCIEAVQDLLQNEKLDIEYIELGKVVLNNKLTPEDLPKLGELLKKRGFELLQDKNKRIIDEIKTEIIKIIHYDKDIEGHVNISDHISKALGYDYSYLSSLFSSIMGVTIEKYLIAQKIEKAKELLIYDELSISEIAYQLNYSSSQHFSRQFKAVTGLSPSSFNKNRKARRKPLNEI